MKHTCGTCRHFIRHGLESECESGTCKFGPPYPIPNQEDGVAWDWPEVDAEDRACGQYKTAHLKVVRQTGSLLLPTRQEIEDYAKSIRFKIDGQTFIDFYTAKGWKIGNTPMKDWQAAVRTWKTRSGPQAPPLNCKCRHCGKPADGESTDATGQKYGWCKECQPKKWVAMNGVGNEM
jgi:hypothetical protein